jgi:creatinine amidohydrolase
VTRDVQHLVWPDVDGERARALMLVVPVGSTEQHGPHLPLSTDTEIAVELARRLAAARPDVVLAPPVAYGSSGEHQAFPGTLSIGPDALRLLLIELIRSATTTFDRVLLVNAHGGNMEALADVIAHQRREGRDVRVWHASFGGDAHAGRTETSVMLALAPRRVRRHVAAAGETAPLAQLIGRLRADGVRATTPNGVLGDPSGASATEGAELLSHASADLISTMEGW